MKTDLRELTDRELKLLLEFAETMVEHQENEFANFGDPNDIAGAELQAKDYIHRRKNKVRQIDDKEDAAIRKQVRRHLKNRRIIKD